MNERLEFLKDKIFNDGTIIIVDDDMMPETFAQDMQCIFGCNPEQNIVCGLVYGHEWFDGCTVAVVEQAISRENILIRLADYVNGMKMQYILCAFDNEPGIKQEYELDLDDKDVEGPSELYMTEEHCIVLDGSNLGLIEPLTFGMVTCGGPSEIAKQIAQGKHFIKELYDTDGTKLI